MPQHLGRAPTEQSSQQRLGRAAAIPERSLAFFRILPWVLELVKRREPDLERQRDLYQDTTLAVWLATESAEAGRTGLAQAMDVAGFAAELHQKALHAEDQVDFVPFEETDLRASDDPELEYFGHEASRALLDQLEQTDREILTLSVQGFSLVEIHRATGVPRSSVQNRLERSLRVLKARERAHIKKS